LEHHSFECPWGNEHLLQERKPQDDISLKERGEKNTETMLQTRKKTEGMK
jgi:hypothetical protein